MSVMTEVDIVCVADIRSDTVILELTLDRQHKVAIGQAKSHTDL